SHRFGDLLYLWHRCGFVELARDARGHSVRRLSGLRILGGDVLRPYTQRMDDRASRALTPLSFRRYVRLFFAALVGFLVTLLVTVLLLLQSFEERAENAVRHNWESAADYAASDIASS